MPNNEHAARLRDMAEIESNIAANWRRIEAECAAVDGQERRGLDAKYMAEMREVAIAAILAGAEVLEAVEVAMAALVEVHEKADDWHSSVEWEGREYTGAVIETIDAALARLEGK